MNATNVTTKILAMLVCGLALVSHSAMAEYKAVTKFRTCELVGNGPKSCEYDPKHDMDKPILEEKQPSRADEADIKACEAIADNINEMEKFHYDWNCGFSISANSFSLSKPPMVELSEDEKCNAYAAVSPTDKAHPEYCRKIKTNPVYGFSYNVDGYAGDEKIYVQQILDIKCKDKTHYDRISFWATKNDNAIANQHNSDPVLFSSRLYFVEYGQGVTSFTPEFAGKNDFAVYAIRKHRSENHYGFVCVIRSTNQPESTKE